MVAELHRSPIVIRRMRIEDVQAVYEIDQMSFSTPWPRRAYLYELNHNPAGRLWVAETRADGARPEVVGMLALWLILDEVHIGTLAVHPLHRRQGIARRLILEALRTAIQAGAVTATLEVRASNLAAQTLYHEFEFEVVSRRRGYYQDNREDALLMTVTGLNKAYLKRIERIRVTADR